jgi:PST family polysaccharide transporter
LTAVAQDNQECNRMVNEQAEVGLLLAGPGILAALTFAPLILITLYSAKFGPAVEVLRWICLGMLLRIVSWPMGFILVAKGARQPFFWSELATSIVQVALVWACVVAFGLKGAGISFFGGYVFYWFLIYFVVRSVSQFRWSPINKRLGLMYGIPILVIFSAWYLVDHWIVGIGGGVITVVAGLFSLKKLVTLVPFHRFPRILQRALTLLRVVAPPPASP